jgi:hypothetical protein
LGAAGVFQEITPPEVKAGIGQKATSNQTKGGPFAMAVDPVNLGTVYAGTLFQSVWKSTDCGATWRKIAIGTNAAEVNSGMNWTFGIDLQDPNVVYTNSGYDSNGLFKSTDGDVNWTDIWSRKSEPVLGKAFTYNFANVIAIDPADQQHILLTFHESCLAPHPATCIDETMDAGATWRIIDGRPAGMATKARSSSFSTTPAPGSGARRRTDSGVRRTAARGGDRGARSHRREYSRRRRRRRDGRMTSAEKVLWKTAVSGFELDCRWSPVASGRRGA